MAVRCPPNSHPSRRTLWTWTCIGKAYLRAKDEGAGRKLLFRMQERLGVPMTLGDFARHAEDSTLYRSTFTTKWRYLDRS